jgi:hypothetical protein
MQNAYVNALSIINYCFLSLAVKSDTVRVQNKRSSLMYLVLIHLYV